MEHLLSSLLNGKHRVGFFGPRIFIFLKNSHQDLSNEGSNFILSSVEVGH